jgi:hypothetical protein
MGNMLIPSSRFTGDNVLGLGTAAVEHLGTFIQSLKKMRSLNCTKGYPAHGVTIENLHAKISLELQQKDRREKQILQTLGNFRSAARLAEGRGKGSVTVQQLVTTMHGADVDNEVRTLALEPFAEETLRKLAEDRRVAFERRGGVKRWFVLGTAP